MELFFDLVFVFTITQLTHIFVHHPSWEALLQTALLLGIIWWMYAGFAWLTNEIAPSSSIRRTLLFAGMAGFLLIALAVPEAFGDTGLAFAIGYFFVTLVHSSLFLISAGPKAVAAMKRFAPFNLTSATLVLAGGIVDGWLRYAFWMAAFALEIATPYIHGQGGFDIRPSHFAERHGLVIIVALGESVVAIGLGLTGIPLTVGISAAVFLGLTLCYALFWAYFGFDDERGERALSRATGLSRLRKALNAYGYAHYPMLLGIVIMAAGIRLSIAHEGDSLNAAAALALAGGVCLFFTGHGIFRWVLGIVRPWMRFLAGAAALVTVPIGIYWIGWAQLTALIGIVFVFIIADDLLAIGRWDFAKR